MKAAFVSSLVLESSARILHYCLKFDVHAQRPRDTE